MKNINNGKFSNKQLKKLLGEKAGDSETCKNICEMGYFTDENGLAAVFIQRKECNDFYRSEFHIFNKRIKWMGGIFSEPYKDTDEAFNEIDSIVGISDDDDPNNNNIRHIFCENTKGYLKRVIVFGGLMHSGTIPSFSY